MNKKRTKYINVNKDSQEYGWIFEEVSKEDYGKIKVHSEPNFCNRYEFDSWELKEISDKSYYEILKANSEGEHEKEAKLVSNLLEKADNFLYGELLEKYNGNYFLVDEQLESSTSFANMEELKFVYSEETYYLKNDEILISSYFLAATDELVDAKVLMDEIERSYVGRDHIYNVECLSYLLEDIDEFINSSVKQQIKIISNLIRKSLNS